MFQKAERSKSKLRMALVGPSGSGKTYTALAIASELGDRVALIDTEHKSSQKYAAVNGGDGWDFDYVCLDGDFSPDRYVEIIKAAEKEGYDVLIIDSLSHAWAGTSGALEMATDATARMKGNKWAAWRDVTPRHNALVDRIIQSPMHVIATMRTKTEWIVEQEGGRSTPKKIGLTPIQREGIDYEFDIVADLDHNHSLIVEKTRCKALDGKVFKNPGKDVAEVIKGWLNLGAPAEVRFEKPTAAPEPVEETPEPIHAPEMPTADSEQPLTRFSPEAASPSLLELVNKVVPYFKTQNPSLSDENWAYIWGVCCERFALKSLEDIPDEEVSVLAGFMRGELIAKLKSEGLLPEKKRETTAA
jgi:DNA polymerase III delta prime subunit